MPRSNTFTMRMSKAERDAIYFLAEQSGGKNISDLIRDTIAQGNKRELKRGTFETTKTTLHHLVSMLPPKLSLYSEQEQVVYAAAGLLVILQRQSSEAENSAAWTMRKESTGENMEPDGWCIYFHPKKGEPELRFWQPRSDRRVTFRYAIDERGNIVR